MIRMKQTGPEVEESHNRRKVPGSGPDIVSGSREHVERENRLLASLRAYSGLKGRALRSSKWRLQWGWLMTA